MTGIEHPNPTVQFIANLLWTAWTVRAFGVALIELGFSVYQKRKFSKRNWLAFYIIQGGYHATVMQLYIK